MSILVDCNQYIISYFLSNSQSEKLAVDMVKRLFLRQVNNYSVMFPEYGNTILCFDNNCYWRKGVFPNYKYSRKKERQKSDIDWNKIFNDINIIKASLYETRHCVMDVDGAEADDIIAVIAKYEHMNATQTLIVSGDKDFDQLLIYDSVRIYNPQQNQLKLRMT